jgi:hypothetical protein
MVKNFNLNLRELQLVYNKSNDAKIGFTALYKSLQNCGKFIFCARGSEFFIRIISRQLLQS